MVYRLSHFSGTVAAVTMWCDYVKNLHFDYEGLMAFLQLDSFCSPLRNDQFKRGEKFLNEQ